jgi:hypothetical protein
LYKTLSKFQNYDTINIEKKLKLFSDFYLPVGIVEMTNYEVEKQQITYSVEELKEMNTERIENELKNQIQDEQNIVNKQINYSENDAYIDIEVIYEVIESIGTKEKIVF